MLDFFVSIYWGPLLGREKCPTGTGVLEELRETKLEDDLRAGQAETFKVPKSPSIGSGESRAVRCLFFIMPL